MKIRSPVEASLSIALRTMPPAFSAQAVLLLRHFIAHNPFFRSKAKTCRELIKYICLIYSSELSRNLRTGDRSKVTIRVLNHMELLKSFLPSHDKNNISLIVIMDWEKTRAIIRKMRYLIDLVVIHLIVKIHICTPVIRNSAGFINLQHKHPIGPRSTYKCYLVLG
jgi:hypothetical protein